MLLGEQRGDNNQMLALVEALRLPFEAKTLSYNALRHFPPLRRSLLHLTVQSRATLQPPWPDLVIGLGSSSVAVARKIRDRSGGLTRLVQIGNPRTRIDDLDLLITTPQFARREGSNVLALPFPIGNPARSLTAKRDEQRWLDGFPRPRRLLAVGGSARKWQIDNDRLDQTIVHLKQLCAEDGGSLIAVTSPRTTERTRHLLEGRLTGSAEALVRDFPRFAVLLTGCDELYVTADSVSMLSEAILTGKPVGLIEISHTLIGRLSHWLHRLGLPYQTDMAKFWRFLAANKLVGTVVSPVASQAEDSIRPAAEAVWRVLRAPIRLPGRR